MSEYTTHPSTFVATVNGVQVYPPPVADSASVRKAAYRVLSSYLAKKKPSHDEEQQARVALAVLTEVRV